MPIRPFPLPFRVGVDICHVPRILRLLTKDVGRARRASLPGRDDIVLNHRFLDHLFTPHEKKNFETLSLPKFPDLGSISRHIAGR